MLEADRARLISRIAANPGDTLAEIEALTAEIERSQRSLARYKRINAAQASLLAQHGLSVGDAIEALPTKNSAEPVPRPHEFDPTGLHQHLSENSRPMTNDEARAAREATRDVLSDKDESE